MPSFSLTTFFHFYPRTENTGCKLRSLSLTRLVLKVSVTIVIFYLIWNPIANYVIAHHTQDYYHWHFWILDIIFHSYVHHPPFICISLCLLFPYTNMICIALWFVLISLLVMGITFFFGVLYHDDNHSIIYFMPHSLCSHHTTGCTYFNLYFVFNNVIAFPIILFLTSVCISTFANKCNDFCCCCVKKYHPS